MYPIATLGRGFLGQQAATYGCPWPDPAAPPGAEGAYPVTYDPNLNCMRDARGNTVCSDGMRYPPGCQKTPPAEYFSPGVTPDEIKNGMIEGAVPPPKGQAAAAPAPSAGAAPGAGPSPALLVGAGALGATALAVGAYFLLKK